MRRSIEARARRTVIQIRVDTEELPALLPFAAYPKAGVVPAPTVLHPQVESDGVSLGGTEEHLWAPREAKYAVSECCQFRWRHGGLML